MTERDFILDLWRDSAGLPQFDTEPVPPLDVLRQTQWCGDFERAMRARLVMGAFRYGLIERQDLDAYDCVAGAAGRIGRYAADHNMEHLVDAANMLLLEFVKRQRARDAMCPVDDGQHELPR